MKLNEFTTRLHKQKYFIIQMAVLGAILFYLDQVDFKLQTIQEFYAYTVGNLLNQTYTSTKIESQLIKTEKGIYDIIRDCTGWKSIYLLSALVITTTEEYKDAIKFLILGILILVGVNIVRLYSTILLSEIGLISFDVIHNWIWNGLMILATLIIWLIYLRYYPNRQDT